MVVVVVEALEAKRSLPVVSLTPLLCNQNDSGLLIPWLRIGLWFTPITVVDKGADCRTLALLCLRKQRENRNRSPRQILDQHGAILGMSAVSVRR